MPSGHDFCVKSSLLEALSRCVQVSEASLPRRARRNSQTFMKMLSGQLLDGWKSSTPTPTPDPKCLLPGPVLSQYVDSPERLDAPTSYEPLLSGFSLCG